uniref:Uncharacterized protein n=1 Tax=Candidatus Kentrum sp. FW TaxID=2126338 RepID=A0A450TCN7_9GAMM|nr:MAG: hypothetical protein BECKFW1821C_GA0114237_100625 [Candidatus Kentron sp. FW]
MAICVDYEMTFEMGCLWYSNLPAIPCLDIIDSVYGSYRSQISQPLTIAVG